MLDLIDNGLAFQDGNMTYAWFRLRRNGQPFYRCVALRELLVIPVSVRDEYDLLGKQWAAVRGLHNAGVNFVFSSLGIFRPDHIGIVQYFGAAGEGETEQEAARIAMTGADTVEAVLANFPQSKLGPPNPDWLRWYLDFVTSKAEHVAAILGHPDPREGARGAEGRGGEDDSFADLATEQNEILFRGMAKLRQNFVFQVLAEHVSRNKLAKSLVRIAEASSNVASRRKGSVGIGFSLGIPLMAALSQSRAAGVGTGVGNSHSVQDGTSRNWGDTQSESHAHSRGFSVSEGESESVGHGTNVTDGVSHTESSSSSQSHTKGHAESSGGSISQSSGWSAGVNKKIDVPILGPLNISLGYNQSEGSSSFSSQSSSESWTTTSSHGTADGTMHSEGNSTTESHGTSHSTSYSETDTDTVGKAHSEGGGSSHSEGDSVSNMASRSLANGISGGFSTGLLPGVNINRTWQTEDDVAERLTDILRLLQTSVNQASTEGGFMTNAFLFADDERGLRAGEALVPQAFHGPNVATPVMTIRPRETDAAQLRTHAFSFSPWNDIADGDFFGGDLWTRYATLLTSSQLAAYTAPGLFEEGSASTVMPPIPQGMGFYPSMPGKVVLGHQYSPETGDLTTAQARLDRDSFMHTIFAGDTGFGKSVAAIRMAYETAINWHVRTVVLDFGAGWRSLLNAPGLEDRVNILQLWPDAVRPLRWNPLQIGRNISPETQWRAFADVFGGIAQLGVKRQKQELLEALRKLYLAAGVLVEDPEVRHSTRWGRVQPDEAGALGLPANTALGDLDSARRQALAVHRSRMIGLVNLYQEVEEKLKSVPPRDTMLTGVLEGILFRLNPLVQGSAALQYAPGDGVVPVEDLSKPWGITIIEGGMFLDDFGKAFLLGWTGWHLYMDMVARRVHEVNDDEPLLQIFFEEANKIFTKEKGGGEDDSGGVSASQRFADMFRDARKYKARLHVISQAPHLIADDIISSCNSIVVGFLKNPKDKDLVLSALAKSEKGFRDEEWRRFVDDIPIGMSIARFPYATRREAQRPMLMRPLMLNVPEPTDKEIEARLGRIKL